MDKKNHCLVRIISIGVLILGLAGLFLSAKKTPETIAFETESNEPHTEISGAPGLNTTAAIQDTETRPETQATEKNTESPDTKRRIEESESETETEPPVYFRENREISQYTKVIMVGDSRFVGMSSAVSFAGCQWICEVGEGIDWLSGTAASQIEGAIEENCAIVFNLGVNDIERYSDYVNFLNTHVEAWTSAGADVYFMSVNPVDAPYTGPVTNEAIVTFNDVLSANLSPWFGYINTYSDLKENGFTTRDGLHYTNETYVTIFQYCMNQLHVVIS